MHWKNGENELDVSKLPQDVGFLVESAIESCAESNIANMTALQFAAPIFNVSETSVGFSGLSSLAQKNWRETVRLVQNHVKPGLSMSLCAQAISMSAVQTKEDINPYERGYWHDIAAVALDSLQPDGDLRQLLAEVFLRLADNSDFESNLLRDLLDLDQLAQALSKSRIAFVVFTENGELCESVFSISALLLLEKTLKTAGESGHKKALVTHLIYTMLEDRDGYLYQVMRQVTPPVQELAASRAKLRSLFSPPSLKPMAKLGSEKSSFHPILATMLENAAETAAGVGETVVDDRQILLQILTCGDLGTRDLLKNVLQWPEEDAARVVERTRWDPLYVRLPLEICECRNLSLEGADQSYAPRPGVVADIIKVLYRKDCHNAALYGERGVGKTVVARLLAEELREGSAAALKITPVIYMDVASIPDEQLESRVSSIFTYMEEHPRPVYVLDNFGLLLEAAPGVCLRRLKQNEYRLVAIIDRDAKILLDNQETATPVFRYVELEEPKKDLVKEMIAARVPRIEEEFDVKFEANIDGFAMRLAGDYILSRRFPQKAISLLESAAADAAAEVALKGGDMPVVGRKDLAEQISEETGLPAETILGTGQDKDYSYLLSRNLVGQDHAVTKVANRLDLIQKGFVDKNRPAAIFMFSGLSGTGKTELAKQIASVYSSSHKIITYTMADFKESHSVSRFIGTPPGYVGYEEGGKLINDINKDPYSLILFDEVEKAHPCHLGPSFESVR